MIISSLILVTSLALSPVNEVTSNIKLQSIEEKITQENATVSTNITNCIENTLNPFVIFLNNVSDLSAISLEIHFNPLVIDFGGIFSYDGSLLDYNVNSEEGVITLSSIFNSPVNGRYQFLQINIVPKEVSESTFTTIDFLVTNAFDSNFNQVNIESCSESFYVNNDNTITNDDLTFSLVPSNNSIIKNEEFILNVYCDELYKINAGNFTLSYDKDLLEYVSYQKGSFLESSETIFDIKYDNPGSINFSFINTTEIHENQLITFTFKSKENIDSSCYLTFTPTNLINNDLKIFSSSSCDLEIFITYSPIVDQKNALTFVSDLNEETKELLINVYINDGIDFAVGDFTLFFDSKYFSYVDFSKTSILNNFYISSVDESEKDNGKIHFHLLTLESDYERGLIYTFKFDLLEKCNNFSTTIRFTGNNLATVNLEELKDIDVTSSIKTSTLMHIFTEWVVTKEPTCTENGVETRTCSKCGESESRPIPATGHDEGTWITTKDPTCTENGQKELHCNSCDEVLDTEIIPAKGHDAEWVVTKEPTTSEPGIESYVCKTCGEVIDTREIPIKVENPNNNLALPIGLSVCLTGIIIAIIVIIVIRKLNKKRHI